MNNPKPKITPALPRGMRDLLPDQLAVRYKVIDTLRRVFELYGFQPLETPAMERLEILSGKGGEESDKLSFLVMKRGAEFQRALDKIIAANNAGELNYGEAQKELADMGLRYDLTVPLARVVAMNQGKLPMPFKRYQIAPVWRAERPQHGRYREFTQCDVDIVGTDSPVADAEIVSLYADAYSSLGLDVEIVINDRQLLSELSKAMGNTPEQTTTFCIALDKLDKIGWDEVIKEMSEHGLNTTRSSDLMNVCEAKVTLNSKTDLYLPEIIRQFVPNQRFLDCISSFNQFISDLRIGDKAKVIFDPTLARGLDYYTGFVVEAKLTAGGIGSLGGGGRYDGLVGAFSKESFPAVGASFGLDRIVDVLSQQNALNPGSHSVSVVFAKELGPETALEATRIINALRSSDIASEIGYHSDQKLGKQIQAAVKHGNTFVVIIGESEDNLFDIKRLSDGEQRRLTLPQIVEWIKESAK